MSLAALLVPLALGACGSAPGTAPGTAPVVSAPVRVAEYPPAPAVSSGTKGVQGLAVSDWWVGNDAAGHRAASISAPTLIADGTGDQLDPVANDHALARLIPGSRLVLYPDAGHGFLFQDWTRFASLVDSFLTG